jgi:hypothetical protein
MAIVSKVQYFPTRKVFLFLSLTTVIALYTQTPVINLTSILKDSSLYSSHDTPFNDSCRLPEVACISPISNAFARPPPANKENNYQSKPILKNLVVDRETSSVRVPENLESRVRRGVSSARVRCRVRGALRAVSGVSFLLQITHGYLFLLCCFLFLLFHQHLVDSFGLCGLSLVL